MNLVEKDARGGAFRARLPCIRGAVAAGEPFLPHDWRVAQSLSNRPVKTTIPGPLTIGDTVADAGSRGSWAWPCISPTISSVAFRLVRLDSVRLAGVSPGPPLSVRANGSSCSDLMWHLPTYILIPRL